MKRCDQCVHFHRRPDEHEDPLDAGQCRRYAPRPVVEALEEPLYRCEWPRVFPDEYCGEHVLLPVVDAKNWWT